jgi:hypothetical protein
VRGSFGNDRVLPADSRAPYALAEREHGWDAMTWIEIAWIAMSAVSLTLGVIHLFVWVKYRSQLAHLLFFALAASTTAFGVFELVMMHAPSAAAYATTLRWAHVPLATVVLSVVWFVRFHFDAGRLWLAWAACGLRLLGLALNFMTRVLNAVGLPNFHRAIELESEAQRAIAGHQVSPG